MRVRSDETAPLSLEAAGADHGLDMSDVTLPAAYFHLETRTTSNDTDPHSVIMLDVSDWQTQVSDSSVPREFPTGLGRLVLPWGEVDLPTIGDREIGRLQETFDLPYTE
ncbi:MAG TPA: hypothetical protein VJP80_02200 [Candidatus Saccharimonadales bacterium]|nr:hypothetical protein [Candidatus Saccharimonadales bacterium]